MEICLTASEVSRLAEEALNSKHSVHATRIEEGGDHKSWFIDNEYVMRFAIDEDASKRLLREIKVRDLVRASSALPVPRSVATGRWGPYQHLSFTLDDRLHGMSAEVAAVNARTERDLVVLLGSLKAVSLEDAAAADVPYQMACDLDDLRQNANKALLRLKSRGQLQSVSTLALDDSTIIADFDPNLEVRPTLIHADLKGEHILLDSSNDQGKVLGVLDWTDALIGDPATDIAGLAISVGATMAARIARGSGYPNSVCARGMFLARCNVLLLLDDRLNGGDDDSPVDLLRKQLSRAYEDDVEFMT